MRIWTAGHSNLTGADFIALLQAHGIQRVVDVRRFPGSRRHPQFARDELHESLRQEAIAYEHAPALGGRRRSSKTSHNLAWRNDSFRAYADYMETPEFLEAAHQLEHQARASRTAIICAEAVWWRCHRGLISDWLKLRGWQVLHIMTPAKTEEHPYTSAATLHHGTLSYRAEFQPELLKLGGS